MFPDLLGYKLNIALEVLKKLGFENINVLVSAPPRAVEQLPRDDSRVVKINQLEKSKIEIIVCNLPA